MGHRIYFTEDTEYEKKKNTKENVKPKTKILEFSE